MNSKMAFVVFFGIIILCGCDGKSQEVSDTKAITQPDQKIPKSQLKKEVIKIDPQYALKEKREEYRTTAIDCRLLPDPNSNTEIRRVPPNTKLRVLEKRTVQQGLMQNNWYKVNYKGDTGWISGWNMKEGEERVVTSVEEMERNYENQIGKKPQNDPLFGKIDMVVKWLNKNAHDPKSIEYIQWYEPYLSGGYWNCRVEFRGKNALGGFVKEDKIFKVKNGSIIEVVDKF